MKKVKFLSKNIQFFGLSKDNKNSYYYSLTNNFLSKIDAKEKNIHLLNEEGSK